ncbi:hypothetical protein DH2020_035473 [Rehmannia glutinosa]|uniref:RBR-type E3 ubiquitin transferase n=1 Tax=Rehmannia glutinosa TaxID=99300 RepID=A0ABR0V8L2_REHGL
MVAIRPLASLKWPPAALKFSGGVAANFEALITVYRQLSSLFRSESGVSIISFILYSASTFFAITLPAWIFLYSSRKKKIRKSSIAAAIFDSEVNEESPEGIPLRGPMDGDESSRGTIGELVTAADAAYAEEVQFHESLLASIFTCEIAYNPSSSAQGPTVHNEPVKFENEAENSSQSFCEICLENKDCWQMFKNDQCSHSFCYECTTGHITAKIQDKAKEIACPAINCNAVLNFDACRLMIPNETLVQWDEFLCTSLIPESHKLYCPFRDCSALLVNDSGEIIMNIKCLECNRTFCAECRVPWHSEFTCAIMNFATDVEESGLIDTGNAGRDRRFASPVSKNPMVSKGAPEQTPGAYAPLSLARA